MATTADRTGASASPAEEASLERWVAPTESPLTVVAHDVRVRYQVPRTDRTPPTTLRGRLTRRRMVCVAAVCGISFTGRYCDFYGIIGRNGTRKWKVICV